MDSISIDRYSGKSKKNGVEFNCFKLTIGEWSTLIFPRTKFEYDYISSVLDEYGSQK